MIERFVSIYSDGWEGTGGEGVFTKLFIQSAELKKVVFADYTRYPIVSNRLKH